MDTILQDARYAFRGLARMRGVALVAIATLALGIGGATTMFSVVYGALLRPLPFAEPNRLVILFNTQVTPRDGLSRLRWSRPHIVALQGAATSFDSIASFSSALLSTSGRGDPEHVEGEVVSPEYFRALRVSPIAGRTFTAQEDTAGGAQPVTVISARLWQRRFSGEGSIVGTTILVNDVPLTIVGVMPDGFTGLSGKAELWIPPPMAARMTYAEYLTTPQHFISVVARLKDGVSLERANAELASLASQFADAVSPPGTVWSAEAMPIGAARVDAVVRRSALALLGAAACVLLIACVNVASLLLARARTRQREMAVRLAIGSSRRRIVQQLLTEGLLMALVAGVCGTILAAWGVETFARLAPDVIPTGRNNYGAVSVFGKPALDSSVLLFALAATLGTTVVFALAPAMLVSRPDLVTALKENDRGSGRHRRALAMLVVSEVALACLLLTASGTLIDSFARLQNRRAGFVADDVLTFWVRPPGSRYPPEDGPKTVERLLAAVEAVPGVQSAAVNRCTPFTGCSRSLLFFPDRPVDRANAPGIGRHYISADYFKTLGIPLLSGRVLTTGDRAGSPPVAVVNETGARRFWPGESAIGKRVFFGTTTGPFSDPANAVEIVGVVGDVKYQDVDEDTTARAEFYTSYLQFAYPDTMIIAKTRSAAAALLPAMRKAVASVDSSLPIYDAMTLDERIGAAVSRPRFNATLLTLFAGAALLLAAIGVYGVLSYSVSSRMREIGVRLALGADARRVIRLVLGEGLRLAAVGAAAGLAAAIAAARFVRGLVVDVSPADPRILAASAIVMLVVAALAAFLPARRASAVDPMVVLRQE